MVAMERQTRIQIMEFAWPLFAGLGFILKVVHKGLFAWWLDPWLQRTENRALWDDVQANVQFLKGQEFKEKHTKVLPFDYASVEMVFKNIRFCFTRGRGELNVSLSSVFAPQESYVLAVVIAGLDRKDITEVAPVSELSEVGHLLGQRLGELEDAFSERQYPSFRERLLEVKDRVRVLTRQAEWNLNKAIHH